MRQALATKEHDTITNIVAAAERLFAEVGFEKTTMADIARALRMSPANVYRFYASKAEINEAVGRHLFAEIEADVAEISKRVRPIGENLRDILAAIEKANADRFLARRKLHDLLETAFNENWSIARDHVERLTRGLAALVAAGQTRGELRATDSDLAALLIRTACMKFYHPRIMVECAQDPEPTVDQMVDFCLAALGHKPAVGSDAGGVSRGATLHILAET